MVDVGVSHTTDTYGSNVQTCLLYTSISVAGSGAISGNNISCIDLDVSIAGSGDINSSDITCNDLQVSVAGSGDIDVYKRQHLDRNFTRGKQI